MSRPCIVCPLSQHEALDKALAAELAAAGFRVLRQEGALGGEVMCTRTPDAARPARRDPAPGRGALL